MTYMWDASGTDPQVVSEETASYATILFEERHDFIPQATVIDNKR